MMERQLRDAGPNIRKWMHHHAPEYREAGDEINSTQLAESAAQAFGLDDIGGPLDDPDSELWDWAAQTAIDWEADPWTE